MPKKRVAKHSADPSDPKQSLDRKQKSLKNLQEEVSLKQKWQPEGRKVSLFLTM